MKPKKTFKPNWVSPPGDTVLDLVEEQGIKFAELCTILNLNPFETKEFLIGGRRLTVDIANRLAARFRTSARFWLNRESQYRSGLVRLKKKGLI